LNLKQRVQLERGQLGSYWLEELAILAWVAFTALRAAAAEENEYLCTDSNATLGGAGMLLTSWRCAAV